jgi:DNA segregation ATPase FtsK/SpoIIIE, S-DNA-T family
MTRRTIKDQRVLKPRTQITPERQREILGLALFALSSLALLSLLNVTRGTVSDLFSTGVRSAFGWGAFGLVFVGFWSSWSLMRRREDSSDLMAWGRILAIEVSFSVALAVVHRLYPLDSTAALSTKGEGGGLVGYAINRATSYVLGDTVAAIAFAAILLVLLPGVLGLTPARLHDWAEALAARAERVKRGGSSSSAAKTKSPATAAISSASLSAKTMVTSKPKEQIVETKLPPRPGFGVKPPMKLPFSEAQVTLTPRERVRRRVSLPPIDLLDSRSHARYSETDANRKARLIEETLSQFGIPARIVEVNSGPTITQFGLEPGFIERRGTDGSTRSRKVSVNRIAALQHDLELALAAAPIRIETPVPGRAIVGIEVPNEQVSIVSLRGVLESDAFKKKKSPLRIALGRDVSGAAVVADLETMPHLLIAGATGSGKSVCINAIVACLLTNNSWIDLRVIMIDPKRVELTPFNGIPHLLRPVVVNMEEVVRTLRWVTREMDSRFSLFAKHGVRNIDAYNEKANKSKLGTMPYLVVFVDELADLMLVAAEETEKLLTRLAQLARATGIHLVLATQRPSVDVVTGLIKANFPARISFAVTSSVDSRVVLDMPGAEKLLGRGDMLYMASDSSKLSRLQGCFVSDDEIAKLVNFWRNAAINEEYEIPQELPWQGVSDAKEGSDEELITKATALAQQSENISISFMQRKLGIGYPRAARLMDQLVEHGVVGPDEGGGKPRPVMRQTTEDQSKKKSK